MPMRSSTTDRENAAGGAADHLTDADLIRVLDGEPSLSAVQDVAAHARACAACAARAELLRERRRRLASLLTITDATTRVFPTAADLLARAHGRQSRYARPALRTAVLLLVAGTLAAQPAVRHWMGRQWNRVTDGARTPTAAAVPVVAASVPAPVALGAELTFEPGSGPLTIRFDVRPTAGTLTIVGDSGSRVTAEQVGGENLELLVMPHGLRVRNAGGGPASYLVRVPRSVTRVHVRFGTSPSPSDIAVDVGGVARQVVAFDRRR
jgi:hypothetical protein